MSGPWLNHLDGIAQQFEVMVEVNALDENDPEDKKFLKMLRDTCDVVRDAEIRSAPELPEVVEKAHTVLDKLLKYAYLEDGLFKQYIRCFAYSDDNPVIEDSLQMAGSDIIEAVMTFVTQYLHPGADRPPLPDFAKTDPWTKTPRPHPLTTRLSRFRSGVPITVSASTPRAQLIYQARAEVKQDFLAAPCAMMMSSDGSVLAMAEAGGYRARDPILRTVRFDEDDDDGPDMLEFAGKRQDPGLSNVARELDMDNERTLIFLADQDRIKSFRWGPNAEGKLPKRLPNVHTMNSERVYNGPLAVLPGGRLLRAGKGKAALWNLDSLETHQDNPKKLIGEGKVNVDNSWREEASTGIERSSGTKATSIVAFADDPDYQPATWHWHQPTGVLLCAERRRDTEGFSCISMDIEHGGRRVTRYLGHGHDPEKFATSPSDPNVFWTAGADGYARMFDIRRSLPVLTFDTGRQSDACAGIVWIHPDGIPTLFTGGERTAQIKMWDVRARACLYELSTGNNAVQHMLWDDRRTTLIASTDRDSAFTMGGPRKFRKAKIPAWATFTAAAAAAKAYEKAKADRDAHGADSSTVHETHEQANQENASGEDEVGSQDEAKDEGDHDSDEDIAAEEEEQDDEFEENPRYMKWPTNAYHNEQFYGYAYNAGEPVILQYKFRENPDYDLPASGGDFF
ncbi:hypothetical protein OH76DRAFT_1424594 [Lentinus brumalis]|uniref:WD40 repeat-like protein n=1 Tax=Lentinus brumalis TaxID=2498619 RepID=A0A371DWV7_9APHY|nr:hypothetical protein OH76DRAFT_1424594 [Polyporus brumalis]